MRGRVEEVATDNWWCHMREALHPEPNDLAKLFFDIAFRQPDPRPGRGNFGGFPNDAEYAFALVQSYTSTDWPCEREDRMIWVAAFRSMGFLVDGRRMSDARPVEPVTLHRAASLHDLDEGPGLAWTAARTAAEARARQDDRRGRRSYVFTATVEPGQLLGRVSAGSPLHDGYAGGDVWLADVPVDRLV